MPERCKGGLISRFMKSSGIQHRIDSGNFLQR
jgi:hypothetical protein